MIRPQVWSVGVAVVIAALMVIPASSIHPTSASPSTPALTASSPVVAQSSSGITPSGGSPGPVTSPCSAGGCGPADGNVSMELPCSASGCGPVTRTDLAEVQGSSAGSTNVYDPCLTLFALGSSTSPVSGSASTTFTQGSAALTLSANASFWISVQACADMSVHLHWTHATWAHPFGVLTISVNLQKIWFTEEYGMHLGASATVAGGNFNLNDFGDPYIAIDLLNDTIPLLTIYGFPILTLDVSLSLALEYSVTLTAGSAASWGLDSPAAGSPPGAQDTQTQTFVPGSGWTSTSTATHSDQFTVTSLGGSLVGRVGLYVSMAVDLLDGLAELGGYAFLFGQVSIYAGLSDDTSGVVTDQSAGNCAPDGSGTHCQWTGPGSCGSNYVVDGLTIQPLLYADGFSTTGYLPSTQPTGIPWLVACAAVGLELGVTWSGLWDHFSGTFWYQDSLFVALPIAATAVVCNVDTPSCTPALTGGNPAHSPYSWSWPSNQLDVYPGAGMVVITPVLERIASAYEELPAKWSTPADLNATNASDKSHPECGGRGSLYASGYADSYSNTANGYPYGSPSVSSPSPGTISAPVEDFIPPTNFSLDHPVTSPLSTICQFYVTLGLPISLVTIQLTATEFNVLIVDPPGPGVPSAVGDQNQCPQTVGRCAGQRVLTQAAGSGARTPSATSAAYPLVFVETGLPSNETFTATVDGVPMSVTTDGFVDNLTFLEPDGAYNFSIGSIPGYSTVWEGQGYGSATVNGSGQLVVLGFQRTPYTITLNVTGFPQSSVFQATVGGVGHSVTMNASSFALPWGLVAGERIPNGTYGFNITPIPGYTATWRGTVIVDGGDVTVNVTLTPVNSVTFVETGLPSGDSWTAAVTYPGSPYGSVVNAPAATITIQVPNGTLPYLVSGPAGYLVTGISPIGNLTVSGKNVTEAIAFVQGTTYAMTFAATNVSEDWGWCVSVGWTICTNGNAIVVENLTEATYPYSVLPIPPLAGITEKISVNGQPASASGWARLNGGVAVAVTFTLVTYALTFAETGLATGTTWQVDVEGMFNGQNVTTEVGSSVADAITVQVPNGTFNYTFVSVPGYIGPGPGAALVSGSAVSVPVTFTLSRPSTYTLTFTEKGLAIEASWSVTLNGVPLSGSGSSIPFGGLVNGSYTFSVGSLTGYTAGPSSGTITVNGAAVSQAIAFTVAPPSTYLVTFTEAGLSNASLATGLWVVCIWIEGVLVCFWGGDDASLATTLANGTYNYTVNPATGYTANPASGKIVIAGAPVNIGIAFTPTAKMYAVTFTESGLPTGTSWSVTFNGTTKSSTSAAIAFNEANGTYTFTTGAVPSYSATPGSGPLTVVGGSVGQAITFTAASGGGGSSSVTWWIWVVIASVIVVVVAIAVALVLRRRPPAA